jgi:beta-lactamase class D OXA-2
VGAVRDEFQVFLWVGVVRSFAAHNQDLRPAMRNSTVWAYEKFAKQIGDAKARDCLRKLNYGNSDPTTARGD